MHFGLNFELNVWQLRMEEIVEGLPGTDVMFDNFLIIDSGHTQACCDRPQLESNQVLKTSS